MAFEYVQLELKFASLLFGSKVQGLGLHSCLQRLYRRVDGEQQELLGFCLWQFCSGFTLLLNTRSPLKGVIGSRARVKRIELLFRA